MHLQNDAAPVNGGDAPSPKKIDAVTDAQRTDHNVEAAGQAILSSVPILPLRDKAPRAVLFQRLDTGITTAEREAKLKSWRDAKPDREGKHPFAYGSTLDGDKLNDWASRPLHGTMAFGVSPGLVNAVVIDCDDRDGVKLRAYLAEHGEPLDIAQTPITRSGRGGWHVWYADPDGLGNYNLKAEVAADVKGVGGQVLLPGMWLGDDGKGSGERHYEQLPGTPELFATIQARQLPPLPCCLRQLMEARGKHREIRDNDRDFLAATMALRAGPSATKVERDTEAMVTALQECSPRFDNLYEHGADHDGSDNRFNAARALVGHYGTDGFDVHDLNEVLDGWEHARGAKDEFDDREVARCYVKAAREFGAINMGDAFPPVVDEDDAEPDPAARWDAARRAFDGLCFADMMGAGTREAHAALVAAVPADAKPDTVARLESLLYRVQNNKPLPATFDEAVAGPAKTLKPAKATGLKFESRRDIRTRSRVPSRYLVAGLLEAAVVFTLHGDYETGKSLVIVDMLHCIAYGLPWAGKATERAGVIYVCPEGPQGVVRRQDAWHLRQAETGNSVEDGPIEIVRAHVDLFADDKHLTEISEQVRTFRDRHGIDCGIVVVDTLRQALVGGDENKAVDIGVFTSKLNKLRDRHGVACGFVHHAGKDPAKGASGSTAIVANVDVELVAVMKAKGGKSGKLVIGKLRDGEDRRDIPYKIIGHDAGLNDEGHMERAGVVVMAEPVAGGKACDGSAAGVVTEEEEAAADLGVISHTAEIVAIVGKLSAGSKTGWVRSGSILDEFNFARNDPKRRAEKFISRDFSDLLGDMATAGHLDRDGRAGGVKYRLPEAS